MAVMEMVHTHSLIHDDLPALTMTSTAGDEKPHVVYGELQPYWQGTAELCL